MPPEDVNTTSRTQRSEADGGSPGAKSLLHSLLGLAEKSKGRVRGQAAVPPVSFRYGAGPGATSLPIPEMTAPPRQDMAGQTAVDPTGSQDAPRTRGTLNKPDNDAPAKPAKQQNDNRHGQGQENNRQAADKESRPQQPSRQQRSTRETVSEAAPLPAAYPAGALNTPVERRILQETGNDTPAKPAKQQNVMRHAPGQENNSQAADKESRPRQLSRQQRSTKETAPEASPPPAAAMLHRQTAKTAQGQTKGENFRKEQGPAAQAADQQAAVKAGAQTVSRKEEITLPGFSPSKSHFPLLSALMNEAPDGAEKPAAGLTTGEAGQKDAVFTRHLQQALPADKREKNSTAAPDSDNQEQQWRLPAADKDLVPIVNGHRLTEKPVPGADDREVLQRLEQMGQSFHQLLAKKSAMPPRKDDPPPRQEAAKNRRKPAVQHVVVIQKNITGPLQERTAAFWERSYLGRSRLTIIR
jgi:hypothetical protein